MNRSGRNPTRRNRNIGTAKSGHGQNNRLVIPEPSGDSRSFYEKVPGAVRVTRTVGDHPVAIVVEPCPAGYFHAVTPNDVERLLRCLPNSDVSHIALVVLRYPKRKEKILSSVWGRLIYHAEIGENAGPAVILEAQPIEGTLRWSKSMDPDAQRELERLRSDGHDVTADRRHHIIKSTRATVRNTQLYRTLPHEIGHYVQYHQDVDAPAGDDMDLWERLNNAYFCRPSREREDFAHRYADEFRREAVASGHLPFEPVEAERLQLQGVDPRWFGYPRPSEGAPE